MAMNSRAFQYYLDNFFKFPKDIKNDIVYCQRSLKDHLKVHQMVIDVFEQEDNADPAQKQRILDEIESEIYEINAEQHFLFLRVRRIVDEFTKMLNRNDVLIDYEAINSTISKFVVPIINDPTIEILPVSVLFRNTEQKLIEKYFEVQKEKIVYEIEDSDEDNNLISPTNEKIETKWDINEPKSEVFDVNQTAECSYPYQSSLENSSSLSQMSLLKPISQRMNGNFGNVSSEGFPDASKFLQMHLVEEKGSEEAPKDDEVPLEIKVEPLIDFPVSKNVKISRLNLRQALNKARTENMAAKATANVLGRSVAPTTSGIQPTKISNETVINSARKYEIRTRAARNASNAVMSENASELNSSSDDSNPEHLPTPQRHKNFSESDEERTLPQHYGQEMFLRIFQLYTPTVLIQMRQRRSKRKRRTVYNNERADFHYGRIEYGSYPPPEKKRKTFLLSPQVKRVLQSKRPKRAIVEKNENALQMRSSSSSPDEKRCCNECFKRDDCFDKCSECKGYYHQMCHIEEVEETPGHKTDSVTQNDILKLCPACKRQNVIIFNKVDELQSAAQELEKKLVLEKNRRASLQQESKLYKLQMRNLFNIVNTIKSDQENDSSG